MHPSHVYKEVGQGRPSLDGGLVAPLPVVSGAGFGPDPLADAPTHHYSAAPVVRLPPAMPPGGAQRGMRLPGFNAEPIQWTREYWVTRRVLRAIWLCVLTGALLSIIIAGVLLDNGHLEINNFQLHRFMFQAGGLFTFLAVPISIFGIFMHLENNSKPHLQRHIMRILWMVPIYALNSWLALLFGVLCIPENTIYFDTLRECYEAFTIYSFYCFTVAAVRDIKGVPLGTLLETKPPMQHWFPFRFMLRGREVQLLAPWVMGEPFVEQCSWGILNYVVLKPLMTALTLVLQVWGLYGDGDFSLHKGYLYIIFINNMWALYCLVMLYEATHDDLAPINPLVKFLCVKGVVFFTFWQQCLLSALAFFEVFTLNHRWRCYSNMHDMVNGIQDALICLEMLGFAIIHAYAFPSREYRVDPGNMLINGNVLDPLSPCAHTPGRPGSRLRAMFDVSDIYEEVVHHVSDQTSTMAGAGASAVSGLGTNLGRGIQLLSNPKGFASFVSGNHGSTSQLHSNDSDGEECASLLPGGESFVGGLVEGGVEGDCDAHVHLAAAAVSGDARSGVELRDPVARSPMADSHSIRH